MNNLNLNKNEIGIYAVMIVIILIICLLPNNNLITDITKDTGSLIIAFVCVCLFMLLDNRLAVLFLVLLVVSYYKNMKNNLAEKFQDADNEVEQAENSAVNIGREKEETEGGNGAGIDPDLESGLDDLGQGVDMIEEAEDKSIKEYSIKVEEQKQELDAQQQKLDAEKQELDAEKQQLDAEKQKLEEKKQKTEKDIEKLLNDGKQSIIEENNTKMAVQNLGVSQIGYSKAEQAKNQQMKYVQKEVNDSTNKLTNAIAKINQDFNLNIQKSKELCGSINAAEQELSNFTRENFLKGRIPEIIRENFVKGGVPFNNQERARNFKDSNLVKNINGLPTQNNRSGYDIAGCRMISSNDDSITKTYDTLNGPPLATVDYDTLQKDFVGTPFYPLNN